MKCFIDTCDKLYYSQELSDCQSPGELLDISHEYSITVQHLSLLPTSFMSLFLDHLTL